MNDKIHKKSFIFDDQDGLLIAIDRLDINAGPVYAEITVDFGGKRWVSDEGLQIQPTSLALDYVAAANGPSLRVPPACAQDLVRLGRFEVVLIYNGRRLAPFLCEVDAPPPPVGTVSLKRIAVVIGLGAALFFAAVFVWRQQEPPHWTQETAWAEARRLLAEGEDNGVPLAETGISMLRDGQADPGLMLLRHAADRGEATALLAIGQHYDPRNTALNGEARHPEGRADLALHSYAQANAQGSKKAAVERAALIDWLQARADDGDNEAAGILDNER